MGIPNSYFLLNLVIVNTAGEKKKKACTDHEAGIKLSLLASYLLYLESSRTNMNKREHHETSFNFNQAGLCLRRACHHLYPQLSSNKPFFIRDLLSKIPKAGYCESKRYSQAILTQKFQPPSKPNLETPFAPAFLLSSPVVVATKGRVCYHLSEFVQSTATRH